MHFSPTLHVLLLLLCVCSMECKTQSIFIGEEQELNNGVLSWTCPIEDQSKNVNESINWYNFLNALYCKLSEYNIQILKRNYRFNDTADSERENCEIENLINELQKADIDEKNLKTFLMKMVKCNITEHGIVENITVTNVQVEDLKHVLNLTLADRLHVYCEGTHMYIKGNYIIAGDISDIFLLKSKVADEKCRNLISNDKTKFVNIFALNTFFVDVNITSSIINSRKVILMSVIAPRWENIGKNIIELNGGDSEPIQRGNAMDGKPGKPGNPGGNFFGIGSMFLNGKNLKISVSGANGSPGEEGRKGENGADGATPTTPSTNYGCFHTGLCRAKDKMEISGFNCKELECKLRYPGVYTMGLDCKFAIYGKIGTKGKNGGKGGKGGKGGFPGNILVIELNNPSQVTLLKNKGREGTDGKGGAGGLGGRRGSDVTAQCYSYFRETSWSIINTKTYNERAESGKNGADGSNSNGIDNPKPAVIINYLDKVKIINKYKSYLRENLQDRFTHFFLNQFLNHLENNIIVKKNYDILGLINELQQIEEQFQTLNKGINFLPFYQSLLSRVSEYAKAPNETGDLRPYKKVLCYLYTAILGRIHIIQDNIESNLIVDIYSYLNSVKNDIEKITDLKNAKYKEKLINKYKSQYKKEIDIKINEAKELISKEITPEIDNIGTEIDSQMDALINEVIHLKEQTQKEHQELIKKQEQLKNMSELQGLFSIFKIFGAIVSFLGPAGAVAGSVIETGSTIAEAFVSNNGDSQSKLFELPQSVAELQLINNRIQNVTIQRITSLKNSLQGISLEILKHPDILSDISFKILSIKNRLDKLDKNKLNFKEIQTLEKELDATLNIQEKTIDNKNTEQLKIIKNLKRIVQINSVLSESFTKYKNNKAKLDAINSAIEQNEEKLTKLKVYEEKIYNSIIPMLQNIQIDIQNIMNKLGTKSKVALDITKWHVQSSLRDMILLMHQLTRGFEVEANLARCLEKLEESMDTLINLHEYIQDYQQDQKLATYIAEISSITVTDVIIANNPVLEVALRDAVRNLEITARSNIVLQRYKVAMNAFKQFVFPFAHNYFKDLILPSHLTLTDDEGKSTLENLVYKAAVEIEKITSKLEDYKNTVTNRDGCIGIGGFQSGYVSSKPFFVWKNEQYNNMISKLLSGDVVTIKADVKNSAPDKDAIKFNAIDFNFKSKNETLQSELNNKLKGFQITVNHLGNSNYRYENKIYEMMTGSQEIWYYFEKKSNGEPVFYSLSYKKIMEGNVTLSPYTSWKIKLDNVTDDILFKDLEIYKDSVDLTLEGYGYFLNKRSRHCVDLMVDKYYKAISMFYYLDSNADACAVDNMYPLQNNIFKSFKIFKGFL